MKQAMKRLVAKKLMTKVARLLAHRELVIVAVTGTVGKTSSKVAIAQVMAKKYNVGYTEDSYNSEIGLPLSIFGLKVPDRLGDVRVWRKIFREIDELIENFPHDALVLEIAEDDLALMRPFMALIHPQVAVVTGVSLAHTDQMGDIGKITSDLASLVRPAKELICNVDFAELRGKAFAGAHTRTYGMNVSADVEFTNIKRAATGYLTAELIIGGKSHKVSTGMVGRHNLASLLAAASVGVKLGIDPRDIVTALESTESVKGRMNLLPGIEGCRLIDDSYNAASPIGVLAALDTLSEFKGRKVAVLGNMNELGAKSEEAHKEVGRVAAKVADLVVVIGPDAERFLAPAAIEAGMDKATVKIFHTPYQAGHFLKSQVTKDDVVLVKGSQNRVFSEEVSRILLDPKLDPANVLVRQSDFWKRKKKKAFAL